MTDALLPEHSMLSCKRLDDYSDIGVEGDNMIRTQIQLTEDQASALKQLAARRDVSMAELIRQGVERILAESERTEKRRRALAVIGRFDTGPVDAAERHDIYLADDYLS